MASSSKDSKVARLLLIESTGEDGRLDIDKAKDVLQELRELPKSKSIPILRNYLKLVKEKERSYQCLIEKAHSNDNSTFSENLPNLFNNDPRTTMDNPQTIHPGATQKILLSANVFSPPSL